ncbi:YicC/YloC family endoribonuclease [Pelagovum sp. HNIBRBA483]|uniref:YicC/YloC family endoribonuclease n=1 Tax=Pelagovum sp. HNIBRBA483 TaxID=3233341 RepID=UPI0034A56FB0
MIHSMTAFASKRSTEQGLAWVWDLRSVNARGLDIRLRLPEGIEGLEQAVRGAISAAMKRGSISLSLKMAREASDVPLTLDPAQLDRTLEALRLVQERAGRIGVNLSAPSPAEILSQRGVMTAREDDSTTESLLPTLQADLESLLKDFLAMRAREGALIADVLIGQLTEIESLVAQAQTAAESRRDVQKQAVTDALARVLDTGAEVDPERLHQELALIAIKADVTEEIDRLRAHIAAARALMEKGGAVGRKLDFLAQEFNREANTLCSKSQSKELTSIGLDLKAAIEQMREQIQNLE